MVGVTLILAINLLLGSITFDYSLYSVFGKDIPWYADAVAGLVLGKFSIPIVCWIVRLCGVPVPFIQ